MKTEFGNTNIFKQTERKLYNYFKDSRRLSRYKGALSKAMTQASEIQRDIVECKHDIDNPIKGMQYSDEPKGSSTEKSSIESALIRSYERLEDDLVWLKEKINEYKSKIRRLEGQTKELEWIIELLDEEQIMIVVLKYRDCLSYEEIGTSMNMVVSMIHKRRTKIIELVAEELIG